MPLKNVLVLHGPNLNLLGERPGDDASLSLDGLNHQLQQKAAELGLELRTFQSNHEGELIDRLHADRNWAEAVVISPDTLAHTSYSLREALVAIAKPAVEVHLTDIRRRESWRRKSVLKDVCAAQIVGKGIGSYLLALEKLAAGAASSKQRGKTAGKGVAAVAVAGAAAAVAARASSKLSGTVVPITVAKTLGREQASPAQVTPSAGKTLGREQTRAPEARSSTAAKTLGRREEPVEPKTIGRRDAVEAPRSLGRDKSVGRRDGRGTEFLTRALVRQKISERLAGKLTPGGLAAWARAEWNKVQEGAPAEVGHRDLLEEALQTLTLSTMAASRTSDEQLVELMAQLEG